MRSVARGVVGWLAIAVLCVAAVVAVQRWRAEQEFQRKWKPRLAWAAQARDAVEVRRLLAAGVDPDTVPTSDCPSALTSAAWNGDVEIAEMLLRAGADVEAGGGITGARGIALRTAAYRGEPEMVRSLLAWGADPLLENEGGVTAVGGARTRLRYRAGKMDADERARYERTIALLEEAERKAAAAAE